MYDAGVEAAGSGSIGLFVEHWAKMKRRAMFGRKKRGGLRSKEKEGVRCGFWFDGMLQGEESHHSKLWGNFNNRGN
jgi:hypothetical protein